MASSSVVPTLANAHYDMNYVQKDEEIRYDETFEIDLEKPKNIVGDSRTDYSKNLKKLYLKIKNFAKNNKIKDWKVESINSTLLKADRVFHAEKKQVENLDNGLKYYLKYDVISNLKLEGRIGSVSNNGHFGYMLHTFVIPKNSTTPKYSSMLVGNRYFMLNENDLSEGIKIKTTISYIKVKNIDLTGIGEGKEKVVDMNFFSSGYEEFKKLSASCASEILKELGYGDVESDKLVFENAVLLNYDELNDKIFEGEYGAGEYHFIVTVKAKPEWSDIITGKMEFAIKLKYPYGDLSKYNNLEFEADKPCSNYTQVVDELKGLITKVNFAGKQSALYFIRSKGFDKVLTMGQLLDAETGKEFTQADFEKMESKQMKKIYAWIVPTEYGKQVGIMNEVEKVFLKFIKN